MVITGAGTGIMQAVIEGAGRERSFGLDISLPAEQFNPFFRDDPKLITFHSFFARNLIFFKEADALVFFPGEFSSHDVVVEAVALVQSGKSPIVPILLMDFPGEGYWKKWEAFVRQEMLGRGFIQEQDLSLFKVVDDVETVVQEIKKFYRNYHSYRFVRGDVVVRLLHPPTRSLIERLNRDFRDVLMGEVKETKPLTEEADDPETLSLPRLIFSFHRMDFGRLRQAIDLINDIETS